MADLATVPRNYDGYDAILAEDVDTSKETPVWEDRAAAALRNASNLPK